MKKLTLLFVAFVSLVALTDIYSQGIPETINYQGLLKDAAGVVVPNGDYDITFRLYSASVEMWSETKLVSVVGGIISTQLGSVNPIPPSIFVDATELGIAIGSGSELSPRIVLTSVPYSFMSMNVPNGSITSVKIADAEVVKSLNGLKDNVNLVAGTNVTITPSGNNLTINAASVGGTIGGSGTTNYIPLFTAGTTLGNSIMIQNLAGIDIINSLSSNINPMLSLTRTGTNSAISIRFTNSAGNNFNIGMRSDGRFGISSLNNNVGMSDVLVINNNNIGIGNTNPTDKLVVDGTISISGANTSELNRTQTGNANLVPIAYANVNAEGTTNINGTTSNVTLQSHSAGSGVYYFNIAGEDIYYTDYVCIATLRGVGGEISWSSAGGTLYIGTANSAGTPTEKPFTFVVYKK